MQITRTVLEEESLKIVVHALKVPYNTEPQNRGLLVGFMKRLIRLTSMLFNISVLNNADKKTAITNANKRNDLMFWNFHAIPLSLEVCAFQTSQIFAPPTFLPIGLDILQAGTSRLIPYPVFGYPA